MKALKLFLSVSPYLNTALAIAVTSIAVMDIYLFHRPEIVPWGAEFGRIYYTLCISMMASYVFYFIVVHLKEQADKENINAFVKNKVLGIINEHKSLINELKKAANCHSEETYLHKGQVEEVFRAINPKGKAPLLLGQSGQHANWMFYLKYHNERVQKSIQKIFVKMTFLDSRLVAILADIDDCHHFNAIEAMAGMQFSNNDLHAWANMFYQYSLLINQLEDYYNRALYNQKP